jgi:hypothetical protein
METLNECAKDAPRVLRRRLVSLTRDRPFCIACLTVAGPLRHVGIAAPKRQMKSRTVLRRPAKPTWGDGMPGLGFGFAGQLGAILPCDRDESLSRIAHFVKKSSIEHSLSCRPS